MPKYPNSYSDDEIIGLDIRNGGGQAIPAPPVNTPIGAIAPTGALSVNTYSGAPMNTPAQPAGAPMNTPRMPVQGAPMNRLRRPISVAPMKMPARWVVSTPISRSRLPSAGAPTNSLRTPSMRAPMNTLAMPTNIPTPPTMPFTGAPVYMPTSSGTPIYMPMPPSAGAPMNMPSSMNVPIMPAAPFTAAQGFPPPQSEALSEHGWLAPIESPTTSPKKRFFTLRYFSFILLAALIVFIVISNCFIKINVVGSSMEPTFKSGDRVWANRWKAPAYGDVVVAYNPEGVPEFLYKRVVGFAGDSFFFSDSNLYRIKNGGTEQELLQEGINIDFIRDIFEKSSVFSGENQIYVVPADGLFLLGDNFNISKDSRFFGSVNKTAIYAVVY